MKTVFKSHSEVAHVFASCAQYTGRTSDGRVYFSDNVIYSYGSHFPIARIVDSINKVALFTTRGYSKSTSKHMSMVSSALSHFKLIHVNSVTAGVTKGATDAHSRNLTIIRDDIFSTDATAKRARTRKADYLGNIVRLYNTAREYIALFELQEYANEYFFGLVSMNIDTLRADIAREEIAQVEAEKKASYKARIKWVMLYKQWKAGETVYGITDNSGMVKFAGLRVSSDKEYIETTRGAKVRVRMCSLLWKMVTKARETGKEYIPESEMKVDYYTLNKVDAKGNLTIGCHFIPFFEVKSIARALGYIE